MRIVSFRRHQIGAEFLSVKVSVVVRRAAWMMVVVVAVVACNVAVIQFRLLLLLLLLLKLLLLVAAVLPLIRLTLHRSAVNGSISRVFRCVAGRCSDSDDI